MAKTYYVFLDKAVIGTTNLEKSDAPMGVVFGKILFSNIVSGYDFFRNYCLKNNIQFTDSPDDKLISTTEIPSLQVFGPGKKEIKGLANSISGMDSDGFEITIVGIEYPFYADEFPDYVRP